MKSLNFCDVNICEEIFMNVYLCSSKFYKCTCYIVKLSNFITISKRAKSILTREVYFAFPKNQSPGSNFMAEDQYTRLSVSFNFNIFLFSLFNFLSVIFGPTNTIVTTLIRE